MIMNNEQLEKEANYFAMCLLMPEDMVREEVDKMGGLDLGSDDSIKSLSKIFGVSTTAMSVRLSQLKIFNIYKENYAKRK